MSNLNFPVCTWDNLDRMLGNRKSKRIAYATTAVRNVNSIDILHHGNLIATVSRSIVMVTKAGWNSRTTSDRIGRILLDNGIPYGTCIRDGVMYLYPRYGSNVLIQFDGPRKFFTHNDTVAA